MKKAISACAFSVLSLAALGQRPAPRPHLRSGTGVYSTVKIGRWTLEKFPVVYLVKPARVYTEHNPFNGKLTYYQELNAYGKPEGLTVTMQDDLSSPASAYYYRGNACVYRAEFFSNSNKASDIVNKDLNELFDGPQVRREFDGAGRIKETVALWKHGVSATPHLDGNQDSYSQNFTSSFKFAAVGEDSLLQGEFFYKGSDEAYYGVADSGVIRNCDVLTQSGSALYWHMITFIGPGRIRVRIADSAKRVFFLDTTYAVRWVVQVGKKGSSSDNCFQFDGADYFNPLDYFRSVVRKP